MAAVLKTVGRQRPGGSNPSASAKRNAAGRFSDRLFLDSSGSQAYLDAAGIQKQTVGLKGRQLHSMLCRTPGQGMSEGSARRNPGRFGGIFIAKNVWESPFCREESV